MQKKRGLNLNFSAEWVGLATVLLIVVKLAVPRFNISWLWALSPLWGVAGFICIIALISKVVHW